MATILEDIRKLIEQKREQPTYLLSAKMVLREENNVAYEKLSKLYKLADEKGIADVKYHSAAEATKLLLTNDTDKAITEIKQKLPKGLYFQYERQSNDLSNREFISLDEITKLAGPDSDISTRLKKLKL